MDKFIVIVAWREETKGWSFECLSVLVTLEHSFMDDNEERNLAERLLSCSRVSSSAGFMDGEEEILELLFPCRETSFSSAPHCLWIPRPLLFSSFWATTSSREMLLHWNFSIARIFQKVDFLKYLCWDLDACQGLWKELYPVLPPVVLHIILVALLRPARKAREVGESSERTASYPSTGVGRGRAAVTMEL